MKRLRPLEGLPVQEFRNVLSAAERITVICHTDMDGLGAARILGHSSFGSKIGLVLTTDTPLRDITPEQEERILRLNPDLIVFLDIAPANVEQLKRLLVRRKGVVVDHHKPKDLAAVPEIDLRFIGYRLFAKAPDRCSTTYLLAELLGEEYDPEFVVSALLGDENFRYYVDNFEATAEELSRGYSVAMLYKQLGSIQPFGSEGLSIAAGIGAKMEALALREGSLHELEKALFADEIIARFISESSEDRDRLVAETIARVRAAPESRELLVDFAPRFAFFASGFIYVLEKEIRQQFPESRVVVIVYQEGEREWRLDGLSTDPSRSVGELFSLTGIGGGHRNVGGGRLPKSGEHPEDWFRRVAFQR